MTSPEVTLGLRNIFRSGPNGPNESRVVSSWGYAMYSQGADRGTGRPEHWILLRLPQGLEQTLDCYRSHSCRAVVITDPELALQVAAELCDDTGADWTTVTKLLPAE